ncbi:hypothetical protein B0H14DRAFT_3445780 [Mycena olivaceomarginata]|nr:hypothetical protein B0H14DRAFT_3445780 [Mycena olivaceomarginata]
MTSHDSTNKYHNEELIQLLAAFNLRDVNQGPPPSPPPRTPSPQAPPYQSPSAVRTFPVSRHPMRPLYSPSAGSSPSRTPSNAQTPPSSPTVYVYDSPTRRLWPGRQPKVFPMLVSALFRDQAPKKKMHEKKKAYIVFAGLQCGVFESWDDTKAVVNRVPNCLYRGYSTLRDAEAAFAYAQARGWTHVSHAPLSGNPALPRPIESAGLANEHNPLHGTETLDDRWFIVYRGIAPGVYRSHLECQLNTLGLSGALHESIPGKANTLAKYAAAVRRGDVSVIQHTYTLHTSDPFL